MRIVVLGCGYSGRGVAYHVANIGSMAELVVADKNGSSAAYVGEKTGARWVELDVRDQSRLRPLLEGATVVFNAVGPYHLYALDIINSAIQAGAHYIDMSDDYEVAEALFLDPTWDARAKEAGIAILSGLGNAPGISGLLARYGYDQLDKADRISIRFVWNYIYQAPASTQHFIRINCTPPQFKNGSYINVSSFTGREYVDFLDPVGRIEVYYSGIPDPVTIPQSLSGLREVTAKGACHQPEANEFFQAMVRWGFDRYEIVPGTNQSPMNFLMQYVASPLGKAYFEIPPRAGLPYAVQVEIEGIKAGRRVRATYEAHDFGRRGTTALCGLATMMIATGEMAFSGVRAAEGCDPLPLLRHLLKEPGIVMFYRQDGGKPMPLQL